MGVDDGDFNIPIDAILQTGTDGVSNGYIVLERGNRRIQCFEVSNQENNQDLLNHSFTESGSNDRTKSCLFQFGRWITDMVDQHFDRYFLIASFEDRANSEISIFDETWVKIGRIKYNQPTYGLCTIDDSRVQKIGVLTKLDEMGELCFRLNLFCMGDTKISTLPIEFLTRLNQDDDRSRITHIASWSNQLYIVDAARHMVYLTDLKGRLRTSIGRSKSDK